VFIFEFLVLRKYPLLTNKGTEKLNNVSIKQEMGMTPVRGNMRGVYGCIPKLGGECGAIVP